MMVLVAIAAAAAAATRPAEADDWPQFRGPGRDGVSAETGLADRWPEDGPTRLWEVALGSAYSGLSVVGERIYTLESRDGREYVVALDVADGSRRWSVELGPAWDDRWSKGPRSTPTVDGGVVFALGSRGRLMALGAADGSVRWNVDLVAEYGAHVPQWGVSASPLVHEGRVFLPVGGKGTLLMAFNRDNGREVWRSGDGKPGYAAPIAIEAAGKVQIVFFTSEGLFSASPASGTVYWSRPWETSYDVNAAAPVFVPPDRVFFSSGYDKGGAVVRIREDGETLAIEEIWRNRQMKNKFSSSVLLGDHLYGFDESTLKCVDVRNGETVWKARGGGHGSLVAADGKLLVLDEKGTLELVAASPDGHRELASVRLFDSKTWTAPTLADGRLYVRDESRLIALAIGNEPVNPETSGDPGPTPPVP
jgi:outer membrane protein assembly factor BamB